MRRCLGLLLLLLLTGCAGFSQRHFIPVDEGTSREVLDRLRQKEASISTLKGLFQVSISGAGIPLSQDLNGILAYRQPNQVHLKGYVRLGVPVLDFHREGNHYELFLPAEGKMVSGQVNGTRQDSEWDQAVLLSLRALDAVLGKIAGLSGSDAQVLRDDQFFRIDQMMASRDESESSSEVWVRTWVDVPTLEVRSIEYFQPADDLVVSVKCEDYRAVKNKQSGEDPPVRLPFSVRATDHRLMGGTVTLNFREFILNAA
ncbi:MAG: hypothetical protein AB7P17_02420 [Nitrospirales bacterium]|nr:hypothetical protein [Nitrospirales bacterium]